MAILSITSCDYADGQAFEADRDLHSGGSEITSLGTPFAASVRGLRYPHAGATPGQRIFIARPLTSA